MTKQSQVSQRANGFKEHSQPFIKFPRDKMDFWINPSITEGAKKLFALICQINDFEHLTRRQISKKAYMSLATVARAEDELVRLNMVRVEIKGGITGTGRVTVHHIINPDLWELPDPECYSIEKHSKTSNVTPRDNINVTPRDNINVTQLEYHSSTIKKEIGKKGKDIPHTPASPQLPPPSNEGVSAGTDIVILDVPFLGDEKPKREKKGKRLIYDEDDMHIAQEWSRYAKREMPSVKINLEKWADEARLIKAEFGFSREDFLEILKFAANDLFWRPNAVSLLGLRKEGRNGMRKIENILKGMKSFQSQARRHRIETGGHTFRLAEDPQSNVMHQQTTIPLDNDMGQLIDELLGLNQK